MGAKHAKSSRRKKSLQVRLSLGGDLGDAVKGLTPNAAVAAAAFATDADLAAAAVAEELAACVVVCRAAAGSGGLATCRGC